MRQLTARQIVVILVFGLLGWALCGAIMFIGMSMLPLQTTLIIHAIGAPIIFAALSWVYFTRFHYTSPLTTATIFVLIVIFMDFFLVSLIINRSLEMFQSLLGTWIPFALLFLATYLTGLLIENRSSEAQVSPR